MEARRREMVVILVVVDNLKDVAPLHAGTLACCKHSLSKKGSAIRGCKQSALAAATSAGKAGASRQRAIERRRATERRRRASSHLAQTKKGLSA